MAVTTILLVTKDKRTYNEFMNCLSRQDYESARLIYDKLPDEKNIQKQ